MVVLNSACLPPQQAQLVNQIHILSIANKYPLYMDYHGECLVLANDQSGGKEDALKCSPPDEPPFKWWLMNFWNIYIYIVYYIQYMIICWSYYEMHIIGTVIMMDFEPQWCCACWVQARIAYCTTVRYQIIMAWWYLPTSWRLRIFVWGASMS